MSTTATATPAATTTATPAATTTATPAATTTTTATPATTSTTSTSNGTAPQLINKTTSAAGNFFVGVWIAYGIMYLIVWIISGISAFVASFICLGFRGTFSDKIIGIIIAILMGPMYWLYFSLNKDYCVSSSSRPVQMQSF